LLNLPKPVPLNNPAIAPGDHRYRRDAFSQIESGVRSIGMLRTAMGTDPAIAD
jgi:hypothetical protein